MPNKTVVKVDQVWSDELEKDRVDPGENIKLKLRNVDENDIMPGFTLCPLDNPCKVSYFCECQIL
jgi:peptide chain release factor subunit 3